MKQAFIVMLLLAGAAVAQVTRIAIPVGTPEDKAIQAITPAPIQKLPNGNPILYPAFPEAEQKLFTSALLAACDGLDGARRDRIIFPAIAGATIFVRSPEGDRRAFLLELAQARLRRVWPLP